MKELLYDQISVEFYNAWIPAGVYFVLSTAFFFLLPRYKKIEFFNVPRIKYVSVLNSILYYGFLFFCIFIPLKKNSMWLYIGISLFIGGMLLYASAMFRFAITEYQKPITKGIYKYSRHPIYVSFFIAGFGIVIASASYILLILFCLYLITTIKIMKAEEEECLRRFDHEYAYYYRKTNRFINLPFNNTEKKKKKRHNNYE